MNNSLPHLIDIKALDKKTILHLLDRANYFLDTLIKPEKTTDTLKGKVIAHLFFEPSTRTRNSFEIAAQRLGAITITPDMKDSALLKGESLLDTIHTMEAMGVGIFVIRHPEGNIAEYFAKHLKKHTAIINAGGGHNQHPTQGLLDLLTIQQHKLNWETLRVAIIGDIAHSRVANSLIDGLTMMGVPDIRLIAPQPFLPEKEQHNTSHHDTLSEGLKAADVIVTLRHQRERWAKLDESSTNLLEKAFSLTANHLRLAKSDAIVMHPGPMNRDVEITPEVADGPQSVILEQVQNGVAMRMAVLDFLTQVPD